MSINFQQNLLAEVAKLLEPLRSAADSPLLLKELFDEVGWNLDAITGLPISDLQAAVGQFLADYELLLGFIDHPPETLDDLQAALTAVEGTVKTIRNLGTLMDGLGPVRPPHFEELGTDLIAFLLYRYLKFHHPAVYLLAVLLTIIRPRKASEFPDPVIDPTSGDVLRFPSAPPAVIQFSRIGELLRDPLAVLKAEYVGPDGLATASDAQTMAEKLFPTLGELLSTLGVHHLFGHDGTDLGAVGNDLASTMLTLFFPLDEDGALSGTAVGATLTLSSADRGNLGLVVTPFGTLQFSDAVGSWQLTIQFTASVDAFAIGPAGVVVTGAPGTERVSGEMSLQKIATADGKAFLVGSTTGTRLEVGQFGIKVTFRFGPGDVDYGVLVEMGTAAIVVAAGDGDGFLQKVFPKDGLRTNFDLALGWSRQKGIYFRGGAGLEATLPVHTSLLGIVTVDSVYLTLRAGAAAGNGAGADIQAAAAASGSIQLGPIKASVDRVGIESIFTFPPEGGNLGPANAAVRFKAPTGLGIAINASAVTGGGYLFYDADKEQYAGVLQLELAETIAIKAIGLLTTRMPDGSVGFSLLVIITAEGFAPIELGFGFTLTGIGGLLGVNRTAAVTALRSGIKNGTLGSILFPADPVRNAPRIVSDVGTVFPVALNRYVFGPMVMIDWGTPALLKLEIGLVLEVPDPVRLLILGRLKATLPDEENPLAQICMDALGVIDFATSQLSLDATLYDSRLLSFVLTGDMAMRANWGDNPNFLLAIGGWNPRLPAPAGFPALSRMALTLSTNDNARLRLECYLAVTSNTVQFGARVDFYFAVQPFSVEGYLGFDALFHFAPFSFIADLSASVALRASGTILMSVGLDMTLSGPSPWHVWGVARFSVLGFKQSISFDAQYGPHQQPVLPAAVDVKALLTAALSDARNWSSELPASERPLVAFRASSAAGNAVRVHPLAELAVRERVVPLDLPISKFGNAPVSGDRQFSLKAVRSDDGSAIPSENIIDSFALAQFVDMSDDQKLSSPAFTQEHVGIRFTTREFAYEYEPALDSAIAYETLVISPDQPEQPLQSYVLPAAVLDGTATFGAAARAATRRPGRPRVRAA